MAEYVAVPSASLLKSTKQSTWISSYCRTGEAQEEAQRMQSIAKGIFKSHILELGSASSPSRLQKEQHSTAQLRILSGTLVLPLTTAGLYT